MVFSYYLYKLPYSILWYAYRLIHKLTPVVFYCGDPLDHYIFLPVSKHLEAVTYVTDKASVREFLTQKGIPFRNLPIFPQAVIMARHSTHKFPCDKITKIGLRHGAYHFKRMTSAASYNSFDLYLMTSEADVNAGKEIGITSAKAVGFPKLDSFFNGEPMEKPFLPQSYNKDLPTLLFTATYDASGMSAIDLWVDRLAEIKQHFNILVTMHPWMRSKYAQRIAAQDGIFLLKDYDVLPYLKLADVIIGDNSSILAEACALDKPMITFKLPTAKRSLTEIDELLNTITHRVDSFDELLPQVRHTFEHPDAQRENRAKANHIFFDELDGKAALRAANEIKNLITKRRVL